MLCGQALLDRSAARVVVRAQLGDPGAHRLIVRQPRYAARGGSPSRVGQELVTVAVVGADRASKQRKLIELLVPEREPLVNLPGNAVLACHAVGNVQQRARRRDRQTVGADPLDDAVQTVEREVEIGGPDIASVDHSGGKSRARGERFENGRQLVGCADQVDVELRERQPLDAAQHLAVKPLEVRRQTDLDRRRRAKRVDRVYETIELSVGAIEHEARLVDLDLASACSRQRFEQLSVDLGQVGEQRQRLGDALA